MPSLEIAGALQGASESSSRKPSIAYVVVWLLQSERERSRADTIKCRLLHTLYGRALNVAMVGLAFSICGISAFVREGAGLAPLMALIGVCLIAARCAVIVRGKRQLDAGATIDPDRALVPFALTALGSSICWGALSFIAMTMSHDLVLGVLVMMSSIGTAGSVAARNASVPRLAKGMLIVSMVPIMAASILAEDRGFMLLVVLVPAMMLGLFVLINESNRQIVELFEIQVRQSHLSITDPLTKLSNRRHFDECIDTAVTAAARFERPLAVLMIDVDHFKTFNDRHGHPAGDLCLQTTADALRRNLRDGDLVFRYGGEEFAIILQNTSSKEAEAVGLRLCDAVKSAHLQPGRAVTISVGVATSDDVALEATALLGAADAALYRAKDDGRDRVARFGVGNKRLDVGKAA